MKDELAASGRLEREQETMGWYTEIGEIYEPPARAGTTADRVIAFFLAQIVRHRR